MPRLWQWDMGQTAELGGQTSFSSSSSSGWSRPRETSSLGKDPLETKRVPARGAAGVRGTHPQVAEAGKRVVAPIPRPKHHVETWPWSQA